MRVVYTHQALADLDTILEFIGSNYPTAYAGFELRMAMIARRIGRWPDSAEQVAGRPGVRVVPMIRYPYKVFYRVTADAVEVLYIHHAARREP